jgi:Na+/proline symporter
VDVVKRLRPGVSERRLISSTKASIVIAGLAGGAVVASGVDYVYLVNLVFFVKAVLIFPLALAIFWPRLTGAAFVWSIVLGVSVGLPIRQAGYDLWGIVALEAVSLLVAVGLSLLRKERFDYTSLRRDVGELEAVPAGQINAEPVPTVVPANAG